jgi:hypothetical protein
MSKFIKKLSEIKIFQGDTFEATANELIKSFPKSSQIHNYDGKPLGFYYLETKNGAPFEIHQASKSFEADGEKLLEWSIVAGSAEISKQAKEEILALL